MNSEERTSRRSAGVVIVGGGECEARAAMSLRKYGWSCAVTVFGAERIPAYERPPLRVDGIESDRRHVRLATGENLRYDRLLLALGTGRARQGDGWTDGEPTRRPLPYALRASGSLSLIIDRIVA